MRVLGFFSALEFALQRESISVWEVHLHLDRRPRARSIGRKVCSADSRERKNANYITFWLQVKHFFFPVLAWISSHCWEVSDCKKILVLQEVCQVCTWLDICASKAEMQRLLTLFYYQWPWQPLEAICLRLSSECTTAIVEITTDALRVHTYLQTKCDIIALIIVVYRGCWQPWGENIRKTLCSLSGVRNIKTSGTVQGAVAAGWRPIYFHTSVWYVQCVRLPWCVKFHMSTLDGMLDIGQSFTLPAGQSDCFTACRASC